MSDPEILTLREAAEVLRKHPKVVATAAREGRLPGHKMGRDWRFLRSELIEHVRKLGVT